MSEYASFNVPDQLYPYIDEKFMAVHEEWAEKSMPDLLASMPEPTETSHGRAVVVEPDGDYDEDSTLVLALPHQQAWKPSMAVRAAFTRESVTPNSRVVVLPNNTVGDSYYSFSAAEKATVESGDLTPYYENRARILEELGVSGSVILSGYSLGGLTVTGLASVRSDRWNVEVLNADEVPNAVRQPKELQRDFMQSGGWGEQRLAIADANLPVLRQALSVPRLAADYARFGLATLNSENAALAKGMARHNFEATLTDASAAQAGMSIKLGHVVGSRVFNPQAFDMSKLSTDVRENLSEVAYSGDAARLHPTGDNPVAHALMLQQAIALSKNN